MSLAPKEQRLLARIEHSLHSSDPRLATMLATFTLPAFRGGLAQLCRSRGREFIPAALAMLVISLIICCGLLLGHAGSCVSRTVAAGRVTACQPTSGGARHPGHLTTNRGAQSSVPVMH